MEQLRLFLDLVKLLSYWSAINMAIEILEMVYHLDVEASIVDHISALEIESLYSKQIEISTGFGSTVYASDIIGLDNYISNFMDDYEIDCGTP